MHPLDFNVMQTRLKLLNDRVQRLNRSAFLVMNVWTDRVGISCHCTAIADQIDVRGCATCDEALDAMDANVTRLERHDENLAATIGIAS